ncbi:MAG TPA: ATP-binding protein [Steroidobacteraceae bacterium]
MARLTLGTRTQWLPILASIAFTVALTVLLAFGIQRASQLRSASAALQGASDLSAQPQFLHSELTLIQRGLETQTYIGDSLHAVANSRVSANRAYQQLTENLAAASLNHDPQIANPQRICSRQWQELDGRLAELEESRSGELYADTISGSELTTSGRALKRQVDQLLNAQAAGTQAMTNSLTSLSTALREVVLRDGRSLRSLLLGGTALAAVLLALVLYYAWRAHRSSSMANEAQRQVSNILNTVREGLFLIDRDGLIGSAHSESLTALLRVQSPAGGTFEDLLRPLVDQKTLQAATRFIGLLWKDKVHEELIESVNPLSQIEVSFGRPQGNRELRYLSFSFRRARSASDGVDFLLGVVADITEQVLLQRELDQLRNDNESQATALLQMLQVDPAQMQSFLASADATFRKINAMLTVPGKEQADLRQKLDSVFRELHAVKGEAAALGIGTCAQRIHVIEDVLGKLRLKKELSGDDFVPVVVKLDELMTHTASLGVIVDRVTASTSSGGDKIPTAMPLAAQRPRAATPSVVSTPPAAPAPGPALEALLRSLTAEVAAATGRTVQLLTMGLDALPVEHATRVKNICVQMIRNAVVHGLESPGDRAAAGKSPTGTIRITFISSPANTFELLIEDDGRGLDYEQILDRALRIGMVDPQHAAQLDRASVLRLIFQPGFSTVEAADEHAGRGVGLDLVSTTVRECGGKVGISTSTGRYTRFKVILPMSPATAQSSAA